MDLRSGKRMLPLEGENEVSKRAKYEEPSCALLRLPAELRLQIYSYLLPDVSHVPADLSQLRREINDATGPSNPGRSLLRHDGRNPCVAIMRTNRLINGETTDMLYKAVALEVDIQARRVAFLKNQTVRVRFTTDDSRYAGPTTRLDTALGRFRKLRVVFRSTWKQNYPVHTNNDAALLEARRMRSLKDHVNWFSCFLKSRACSNCIPKAMTMFYIRNSSESLTLPGLESNLNWLLRPFLNLRNLHNVALLLQTRDDYLNLVRAGILEISSKSKRFPLDPAAWPIWAPLADECERVEEVQAKFTTMCRNFCAPMCGDGPAEEPEPLNEEWARVRRWTQRASWVSHERHRDELLLSAWKAYDEGSLPSFAKAVELIEQLFDDIQAELRADFGRIKMSLLASIAGEGALT